EIELRDLIKETVAQRSCLIIPAFAIGRTQDLIYTIRKMEDDGEIPAIPVHVDSPMGLEATEIYCRHTEEHDFEMQQLRSKDNCPISSHKMVVHKTPEQSKSINQFKGPMVIISASGMARAGACCTISNTGCRTRIRRYCLRDTKPRERAADRSRMVPRKSSCWARWCRCAPRSKSSTVSPPTRIRERFCAGSVHSRRRRK
ncbi:MAG: hypothetical protein E6J73_05195, partial [Deltaproteobacteria bacterium]